MSKQSSENKKKIALPRTKKEFDVFCAKVFKAGGFPDRRSYRHAIAAMIMHLDPLETDKEILFFVSSIKKAQANELAYEIMQEIKKEEAEEKQKEAEEAKAKAQVENPLQNAKANSCGLPEDSV